MSTYHLRGHKSNCKILEILDDPKYLGVLLTELLYQKRIKQTIDVFFCIYSKIFYKCELKNPTFMTKVIVILHLVCTLEYIRNTYVPLI